MYVEINEIVGVIAVMFGAVALSFVGAIWSQSSRLKRADTMLAEYGISITTIRRGR